MILRYLAGPLVGAVIGYFTNYIAVKMLFRPKHEIYLWGHRLPFTPGAIPKGKPRLAKAVGNIVAGTLITEEDIEKQLISDDTEKLVIDKIMGILDQKIGKDLTAFAGSEEKMEQMEVNITAILTSQILDCVNNMDIGSIIAEKGTRIVQEKLAGTMMMMFLTPDLLQSIIEPMGGEINTYIQQNGRTMIEPELYTKMIALEEKSILQVADEAGIERDAIENKIRELYRNVIRSSAKSAVSHINIAGIIEDKINAMSVDSLEDMVMAVMKQELDTIVNLGALIGCVIGILNIFL